MIRWEYRTLKFDSTDGHGGISTSAELQDYLNRLGDQCWEVTGVMELETSHHQEFLILMKRPKN